MSTVIRLADQGCAESAESLVAEYLDDVEGWRECLRRTPHLVWCAIASDVVGVCYGKPSRDPHEVVLQGVAVAYDVQRQGVASRLLRAFEQSVAAHGGTRVSLGSGRGAAELFYLSNGYEPVEYLLTFPFLAGSADIDELTVTRWRPGEQRTLVNASNPDGYQPEIRDRLQQRYGATEVNYIFAKSLV